MSMRPDVEAMVKSLVAVAWADGLMHREEQLVLDALVVAFQLDEHDTAELRAYAKTPRTLDDLQLGNLLDAERRALLQHALLLTHADGHQTQSELDVTRELARRLDIPADETAEIVAAAERRAKRARALR
jgi:tellurite resistance protein